MKHNLLLFLLLLLPVLGFSQSDKQLPIDKEYRIGKLENGLTYYIRHNELPKNQVCFYIAQNVGSMQEEESQRGLAHLLEHMAFNGTEHFPNNRMISFLEGNGIKFGAELNAYTSLDKTVYNIDNFPTDKGDNLIDSCLQILADWSGGVSLLDDEIDKERGVVKSEYLMRNSPSQRQLEALFPVILKDCKYGERMPIGLMSVVEGCSYDELRAYYKKWYHPSLQGIIVVGDIDVDVIESKIKKIFSVYKNPENEAPRVEHYCPFNDKPIFASAKDKEQTNTIIYLYYKFAQKFPRDKRLTKESLEYDLSKELISNMISNRISDMKEDSPLLQADGYMTQLVYVRTMDALSVIGIAKDHQELESYKKLLRESLRIKKYGFTQNELERAKADLLTEYENEVTNQDKQQNRDLVERCVDHFTEHEDLMSIKDKYDFVKAYFEKVSLSELNNLVEEVITKDGKNLVVFNFAPEKEGQFYFTPEIYQKASEEVWAEKIKPYKEELVTKPLLKKTPKEGSIVKEDFDKEMNAKILQLSNGAKVIIKQTDYKKDEIQFYAYSEGGTSLYDDNEYYNFVYADDIVQNCGLGNFSKTQLEKLTQGKSIGVNLSISNLQESLKAQCAPKDFDFMMQMVYCYFTNPGHNKADFKYYKNLLKQGIQNRKQKHKAALSDTIKNNIYNHNIRVKSFETEDVDKLNLKRIVEIYKERYADASNFIYIVIGNYDEEELKSGLCKYIASLPSKNSKETFKKGMMEYNMKDIDVEFKRKMETPESTVSIYFLNKNFKYNLENSLKLNILSQIMTTLQLNKVREESSIAYTTRCNSSLKHSETKGDAMLEVILTNPVKPEYAKLAEKMLNDIVKDVCENGFEDENLQKVKAFMIKHNIEQQKNNNYWLGQLIEKYIYNNDMHSNYENIVNGITVKDLQDLLKTIVTNSKKQTYIMMPEGVDQKENLD